MAPVYGEYLPYSKKVEEAQAISNRAVAWGRQADHETGPKKKFKKFPCGI
jgi:hypothetical protein